MKNKNKEKKGLRLKKAKKDRKIKNKKEQNFKCIERKIKKTRSKMDLYEIYYLDGCNWNYFMDSYDITDIAVIAERLTTMRPNQAIRIDKNEKVLTFLNGTEYQLLLFVNNYCDPENEHLNCVEAYNKVLTKIKN